MPDILTAENLQNLSGVRHGFFTSAWGSGGFSGACDSTEALDNRRRITEHFAIKPEHLLSCDQIHSPNVVTVMEPWSATQQPRLDAMVTKKKGIGLGVLTADCVPLLFADNKAGVIGAAHAGWRGALTGVIENTLTAMEALGARRRGIHAALGPCIWQNSYEVGPEFPAPFLAENPDHQRLFRPAFKSDRYMFNLPAYVESKLHTAGVTSVGPSPADTCADETRFFSYRRSTLRGEQRAGNLISVIVLTD